MISNQKVIPYSRVQKGLSIVELLVSLAIGMLVLAGSIQVVVGSKKAFVDQDEVQFIQTNARYALDIISRDLKLAGYLGCTTPGNAHITNTVQNNIGGFVSFDGVKGFEGGSAVTSFPDQYESQATVGTDSLLVRHVSSSNELNVKQHNPSTKTITLWNNHSYAAGSTLAIVDANCRSAALFHASSVGADTLIHNDITTSSCLTDIKTKSGFDCTLGCYSGSCGIAGAYNPGSKVMELVSHAYFVGPSTISPGISALKRQVLTANGAPATTTEEIALGVDDLEVLYGYDSSGSGSVDQYKDASAITTEADWARVISVKLNLVLRSNAPVLPSAESKTLAGQTYNDRFMRQLVSTTVRIRNRG